MLMTSRTRETLAFFYNWRYTVSKGSRLVPLCFSCIFTTAIKWANGLWLGRCIVGLLKLRPPNLLSFIVLESQRSLHALTLISLHTSYVSIGNKLTFSLLHMIPLWCSYISMESRIHVSLGESASAYCYYCSFTIVQTFATISLFNISKLSDFYSSILDSHSQSPFLQ